MEWPESFYAMRRGEGLSPLPRRGRGQRLRHSRPRRGRVDAYLQRKSVQRGYTVVVWRGRHVAEPTELDPGEAAGLVGSLVGVGAALEQHFEPVKLNYELLGNRSRTCTRTSCPGTPTIPRPGWPFPWPDEDPPPFPEDDVQRDAEALRAVLSSSPFSEAL